MCLPDQRHLIDLLVVKIQVDYCSLVTVSVTVPKRNRLKNAERGLENVVKLERFFGLGMAPVYLRVGRSLVTCACLMVPLIIRVRKSSDKSLKAQVCVLLNQMFNTDSNHF